MKIESLYRYPVKGLTPEPLASAELSPGRCLPWDRAFALAQGDSAFNPAAPAWVPKSNFMCLAKNARAALLDTRFDEVAEQLTITPPEGPALTASPFTASGRAALAAFLIAWLGDEARLGPNAQRPHFHYFPGHSFCDHQHQVVSLIGLGSLDALAQAAGAARDARRFRANIYVSGLPPWAEFSWLDRVLAIGTTRLLVQHRIDRCAATMVNPDTAVPDANPVRELRAHFGHIDLGVFATVLEGGEIRPGDEIRLLA